jgi:hypothetical protein
MPQAGVGGQARRGVTHTSMRDPMITVLLGGNPKYSAVT